RGRAGCGLPHRRTETLRLALPNRSPHVPSFPRSRDLFLPPWVCPLRLLKNRASDNLLIPRHPPRGRVAAMVPESGPAGRSVTGNLKSVASSCAAVIDGEPSTGDQRSLGD